MAMQSPDRTMASRTDSRHHFKWIRWSRHAWLLILLLVFAAVLLALCGRSASAQVDRVKGLRTAIQLMHDQRAGSIARQLKAQAPIAGGRMPPA